MKQTRGQVLRLLRRSTALALALAGLWVWLRTADFSGAGQTLRTLGRDSTLAVRLVQSQLHSTAQESFPGGWTRLVLAQSPLLLSGQEAAGAHLAAAQSAPPVSALPADPRPTEPEDEDLSEPPITIPSQSDGVIARTLAPSAGQTYLRTGEVYIANRTAKQPDADALARMELNLTCADGPQILIIHTHGSEAYTPSGEDLYQPSDPYRTTNTRFNMVRVGEEMAGALRQAGLSVLHDTTLYDYPSYNEAYDRSLAAVEQWLRQYPSIQVVLDVHRDALAADDGTIYKAVSQEQGEPAAQIMLVVGTDSNAYHPLWQENLAFGIRLQQQLLTDWTALARPMVLRASRFNQHLSVGSVLVEVGTHGNTLREALTGARLFARSAAAVLTGLLSS